MTVRRSLTGELHVDLPPEDAIRLFTPRGEQDWVDGWSPKFADPAADDTEPGTVFETHAHGASTTWVVIDRRPGRRMSYARVTPGARAGTVTVDVESNRGGSEVTVTYDLTALHDAAEAELADFAANYPAFLRSWEDKIAVWLSDSSARHE